ncbi:MAG: hypothetical protein HDT44_05110 [Ruminococcaceae bacterium]|nr:hypothetical protein [Oscillospiraceae bacterium]
MKNQYKQQRLQLVSPEVATVTLSTIPKHRLDNLCRATLHAVERYFELPGVREEYEEWLKEYRKQNKS